MTVALWAEIRRLSEIERLSRAAVARRLHCCHRTVARALAMSQPPSQGRRRASLLNPYREKIDAILTRYPELSAVRICEEIAAGPEGYRGGVTLVRRYLRQHRPDRRRVYQEVAYDPGEAMQVDWGDCGHLPVGQTRRRLSVLVAVLCYSRLTYLEFCLSQRKSEFYRAVAGALRFFGGSPRRVIVDNLKAAVVAGAGRHAHFHPEWLALCGHFQMESVACAPRDPQSKGIVEATVRYVKQHALAGRAETLVTWEDHVQFAPQWRDQVANVRVHQGTGQRPIDRFKAERARLRPLPVVPFDTDEVLSLIVTPHARVNYEGNRYSVPCTLARKPVVVRVDSESLRVLYQGQEVARHRRGYEKRQLLCLPEHRPPQRGRRAQAHQWELQFQALGPVAVRFAERLRATAARPLTHVRRLLHLAALYGRQEVVDALELALEYQTCDAAYVETLLSQRRRRQQLPSPMPLCPRRRELIEEIDLEEPDPGRYDRLGDDSTDPENPGKESRDETQPQPIP